MNFLILVHFSGKTPPPKQKGLTTEEVRLRKKQPLSARRPYDPHRPHVPAAKMTRRARRWSMANKPLLSSVFWRPAGKPVVYRRKPMGWYLLFFPFNFSK